MPANADPANARALVGVAAVDSAVAVLFASDDGAARLAAAETALTEASSLAPESALAHLCLGVVQTWTNRALRASENASERWGWIEIWPTRTHK